jgi:putative tributyrin esterase
MVRPCKIVIAIAIVLTFVASAQSLPAQTLLLADSAYSSVLQRMKTFGIMLPQGYDTTRRYPVLYLLHGWGGGYQDWSSKTRLQDYISWYDIIVVMPDGENSWYVNSAVNPRGRFEDYVATELPAHVASRYAADTSKQAIAGLSMGGYGAVLLGMKYPARYSVIGSFSGALTMPRDLRVREGWNRAAKGNNGDFALPSLQEAFGKENSPAREKESVFTALRTVSAFDSARKQHLPYVYLATGIQDPLSHIVPGNRELRDSLYAAKVHYEYHETPGKHSWGYWNDALRAFLPRMMELTGWK